MIGLACAGLVVFGGTFSAYAACTNPSPLPSGYAAPCPVWSVSPASVSQSGTLALSATPQAGTDYIYTTAYYAKGSTWLPVTLTGNNAAPSYSSGPAQGSLSASILSTLSVGTNYVVLWDWLWDATSQCYKGPGLNQCNTGTWRLQTFDLTQGSSNPVNIAPSGTAYRWHTNAAAIADTNKVAAPGLIDSDLTTDVNLNGSSTESATLYEAGGVTWAAFQSINAVTFINGTWESGGDGGFDANLTLQTTQDGVTWVSSAWTVSPAYAYNSSVVSGVAYTFSGTVLSVKGVRVSGQVHTITAGSSYFANIREIQVFTSGSFGYTYSQASYASYTYSQSAYMSGVNYYVSPTGSGTACTKTTPCSVTQGFANFTNGTAATIHFASGTYATGFDVTKGGGSLSSRLVLQCDAGVASAAMARNQCKITGTTTGGAGFFVEASFIDIVGFDIGNNANMATGGEAGCNVSNGTGVVCPTGGNSVHWIGNVVHDLGSNVRDSNNVLGCPEAGALTDDGHNDYFTDEQVLRNFIFNYGLGNTVPACNHSHGIYMASPGVIVENNIIVNMPTSGITPGICGAVYSNNIIVNTQDGIILSQADSFMCPGGVPGHSTYANNYISGTARAFFNVSGSPTCSSSAPELYSHNITDGGGTLFSPARTSCATVVNAPTPTQACSSFVVNCATTGSGGDYHLKSGSVGIGNGSSSCVSGGTSPCTPTTDFSGISRPQGSAIDIGAYEQ